MNNFKNNKKNPSIIEKIPLEKRKILNKEFNIFKIITIDIWKIIFEIIYKSVDCNDYSNIFKNIRFTCKLFRELSLQYWNQNIPEANLEYYFAQKNSLESIHNIVIVKSLKIIRYSFNIDKILIDLKKKKSENYWKGFSDSCECEFLPIIKKMLKDGANVNQVNPRDGRTPLFYASYSGRLEAMKILIENGDDVNVKDNNGHSILISLFPHLSIEILEILIENGADVNEKNKFGKTLLSLFYELKLLNLTYKLEFSKIIKFLITKGASLL